MTRYLLLLSSLLLVGGCSTVSGWFGSDEGKPEPPTPLADFTPGLQVSVAWSRSVGSGAGGSHLKLVPAVAGERVFAADRKGKVMALAAADGAPAWEAAVNAPLSAGPGVGGGMVVVAASDGQVIALDADTGTQRWQSTVSSEVLSVPQVASGKVIVQSVDGKVTALDAADGKPLWNFAQELPVLTLRGSSTPALVRGGVVAGFDNGKVFAITLDKGIPAWEAAVAVPHGRSELERMVDVDADPVVAGGGVFAASYRNRVVAITLEGGQVAWGRDLSCHVGLAAGKRALAAVDDDDNVWAFDPRNGGSLWKQEALAHRRLSGPAADRNAFVMGDLEGYVHWLDEADGHVVARTRVGSEPIEVAPVVEGNTVYVLSSGGTLAALRVE